MCEIGPIYYDLEAHLQSKRAPSQESTVISLKMSLLVTKSNNPIFSASWTLPRHDHKENKTRHGRICLRLPIAVFLASSSINKLLKITSPKFREILCTPLGIQIQIGNSYIKSHRPISTNDRRDL
jgi:hypothetical protein